MNDEKIKEFEATVDNLLLQSGMSMAKEAATMQMVLGVYRRTLDKDEYNIIVKQYIHVWGKYGENTLNELESIGVDLDLIARQREQLKSNLQQMETEMLS